jgi:hypothetical protein
VRLPVPPPSQRIVFIAFIRNSTDQHTIFYSYLLKENACISKKHAPLGKTFADSNLLASCSSAPNRYYPSPLLSKWDKIILRGLILLEVDTTLEFYQVVIQAISLGKYPYREVNV